MAAERLRGTGVAVTRAACEAGDLARKLQARGAHVALWPCIGFADAEDIGAVREAVRAFDSFDWIAVTSPRAVSRLAAEVDGVPCGSRLAAAGPVTAAALADAGWPVHRVAAHPGARGLADEFARAGDAEGSRVLFACGDRALEALPTGLEALGATVTRVVVYRTLELKPEPGIVRQAAESGMVRVITFASPSAVSGFLNGAEADGVDPTGSFAAAAIGPTTAEALRSAAWEPVTADEATMDGLVEAAAQAAGNSGR